MSPAARTASARKAVEQQKKEAAGQAQQPHETRAKACAAKAAAKAATKAALEKRNRPPQPWSQAAGQPASQPSAVRLLNRPSERRRPMSGPAAKRSVLT